MWHYADLTPAQKTRWHNYTTLSGALSGTKNFSLWWYFRAVEAGLAQGNDLLRAFLFGGTLPQAEDLEDWTATIQQVIDRRDRKPSVSQRKALEVALTEPVSFIQGPPGTGKTETILNLMECIVDRGKTVAMVSPNNMAVKNVIDKVYGAADPRPGLTPLRPELADRLADLGPLKRRKKFNERPHRRRQGARFGEATHVLEVTEQSVQWVDSPEYTPPTEPSPTMKVGFEPRVHAQRFVNGNGFLAVTSTVHSLKKCFFDGLNYQYDYLIMDEASQADTLVGLVALSCARHLVLVGDIEQLPPVSAEKYAGEAQALAEGDCASGYFLRECIGRFATEENSVLLDEHFRCHPGIIGFCNQYVYDRRLTCRTRIQELDDYFTEHYGCASGSFPIPIRVLWFEGKYAEKCGHPKLPKDKTSKSNQKQIEIFLREEWPRLRQRMARDTSLSVSILCPYKGLLYALHDKLTEDLAKRPLQGLTLDLPGRPDNDRNAAPEDDDPENVDPENVDLTRRVLSEMSIHRSQGQEYDIVYFFPVDDGTWEWPWSQQKNLINVAVSRAKRELCLIAATPLMTEAMQRSLVGRVVPAYRSPENDENREEQEKDELFVQKLLEYVWTKGGAASAGDAWQNGVFGFHKSKVTSIFDGVPIRQQAAGSKSSAPEACMAAALEPVIKTVDGGSGAWSFETEVPVATLAKQLGVALEPRDLKGLLSDEDMLRQAQEDRRFTEEDKALLRDEKKPDTYLDLQDGGKFDFVLYQNNAPRLIVEVDGQYHRERKDPALGDETHANDLLKDELVKRLLALPTLRGNRRDELDKLDEDAFCAMLRLPTDGSTCWEVDALRQVDEDKEDAPSQKDLIRDTFSLEELLGRLRVPLAEMLRRDKEYLSRLCNGADPVTGRPLPSDSILVQPAVCDAISEGEKSLGKVTAYDSGTCKDKSRIKSDCRRNRIRAAAQVLQALSRGKHPDTEQDLPASDPACQTQLRSCFCRVAEALERSLVLGYCSAKADFALSRTAWERIQVTAEPCTMREFICRVNVRVSDPTAMQLMSNAKMWELLLEEGILTPSPEGGKKTVLGTRARALGIQLAESASEGGDAAYQTRTFSETAQRYMLAMLEKFVAD